MNDDLEQLKNLPTLGSVLDFAKRKRPDWIIGFSPKYSDDYPDLTSNWKKYANGKPTTQIMLVEKLGEEDDLIKHLCEIFTMSGFSVRRKKEFFLCPVCGAALPSRGMYEYLKDVGKSVPAEWKPGCLLCK
jgi:hypothetical protein